MLLTVQGDVNFRGFWSYNVEQIIEFIPYLGKVTACFTTCALLEFQVSVYSPMALHKTYNEPCNILEFGR